MGNLEIKTEAGILVYGSTSHVLRHSFGNYARRAEHFLNYPNYTQEEKSRMIQDCKNDFVNLTRAAYDCADLSVEEGITRHYVGYIYSLADMLDWSKKEDLGIIIEELSQAFGIRNSD